MTIFLNNMKRLLRNKLNLAFMIAVPVVLISVVSTFSNDRGEIRCGVVDHDNTTLSWALTGNLDKKCEVSGISENDINKKIFGQYLDVAVIIDEGFEDSITGNRDTRIKVVSLQETDISAPVILSIENFTNAAANLAAAAGGSKEVFFKGLEVYQNKNVAAIIHPIDNGSEKSTVKGQMGFLVMGMLLLASLGAMIMIEDKEKNVYYRILAAPVRVSDYLLQCLASFFALSVLQVLLIFLFMAGILRVDFGPAILSMFAVSVVFSLCCVSLGVAINTISQDMQQSTIVMALTISPMCMLGGAWWPMEFMPELLQRISLFIPVTWIMRAYEKLLYGQGLASTAGEISVLLGFTVLFLLFASWKRMDVAR